MRPLTSIRRFAAPLPAPAVLAALSAASLAVVLGAPAQYLGRQQDDLLYLISSHALLRGEYRLFTSVGAPPLVMITPGFPLLLLPVSALAGEAFGFHQALSALALAAVPWALWAWLKGRLEGVAALLVCALCATSPLFLCQAGTVMSEAPYLLLAVALLAALEGRGRSGLAGWLALALTQIRPAGLSALPALLARPWRERRWKDLALRAAPPLLGMALWSLWSWKVSGSIQEADEWRLSYAGLAWARPLAVAADNAGYYLSSWGSCYLPSSLGGGALGTGVGLVLAALAAAGLGARLRKDPCDAPSLMLAGGALMHAFWAWQYERYLIPLLPLLLLSLAAGLKGRARPALAALLVLQCLFQAPRWVAGASPWKTPELSRTYAWISAHSAPGDALASPLHVRDGFYCVRPSLPLPDPDDAAAFAARLKSRRARLVLWQDRLEVGLSDDKTARLRAELEKVGRLLQDAKRYRLLHEDRDEGSRVYAVL